MIVKKLLLVLMFLVLLQFTASATLNILLNETVNEAGIFNGTADYVEVQGPLNATGKITVNNTFAEQLYDITINFNDQYTKIGGIYGCSAKVTNATDTIHITYLDRNEAVTCNYVITLVAGDEPLNFEENYSNYKPLVDTNVTITTNISNNQPDNYSIFNINCTKRLEGIYNFSMFNISGEPAYMCNPNNNLTLCWDPTDLNTSTPNTTSFIIQTPNFTEVPQPVYTTVGNWSCEFYLNNTVSGYKISTVTAGGGDARFGLTKRQSGTLWLVNSSVNNSNTFAINVTYVARWATEQGTTTPEGSQVSGSYNDTPGNLPAIVLSGGIYSTGEYNFTYALTPVVWMNSTFFILDNSTYIVKTHASINGTYKYTEKMWVINGYKIEITKTITNTSVANSYNVTLFVINTGSADTPDDIYIYDFVPNSFLNQTAANPSPRNMSITPAGLLKTNNPTMHGNHTGNKTSSYGGGGLGFWWLLYGLNASAPNNNVTINYLINGSGDFYVGDTFIVGIDPIQTGPGIASSLRVEVFQVSSVGSIEPVMMFMTLVAGAMFVYGKRKRI